MSHSVWFGQRWCVCLLYFYIFFFIFKKKNQSIFFHSLSSCINASLFWLPCYLQGKRVCHTPETLLHIPRETNSGTLQYGCLQIEDLHFCSIFFKHKHRTKISIGHNQEVLWTRLDRSPPQHLECGWFLNYKKQTLQIHTLPFGFASTSWTNLSCGAGSILDHV